MTNKAVAEYMVMKSLEVTELKAKQKKDLSTRALKMKDFHELTENAVTRTFMNWKEYRQNIGQYNWLMLTQQDVRNIYKWYLDKHQVATEKRLRWLVEGVDIEDDE